MLPHLPAGLGRGSRLAVQPLSGRHLVLRDGRSHRIEVIEAPAKGRAAGRIEILGDADPGEGGYGNVYVTIPAGISGGTGS